MVTVDEMQKFLHGMKLGKDGASIEYVEVVRITREAPLTESVPILKTALELEEGFVTSLTMMERRVERAFFKRGLKIMREQDESHVDVLRFLVGEIPLLRCLSLKEFIFWWATHLDVDERDHVVLIDLLLDELAKMRGIK